MRQRTSANDAAPVAEKNRIQSLDILRGVALLGILLLNIPEFSLPQRYSEAFRSDAGTLNFWIRAVVLALFEGKMRALFSILFGAGILLFIANKKAPAKTTILLFYRRMFWLVLFGLADAHLLLWIGDILYCYGIIGMAAFLFRKMRPGYLVLAIPIVAIAEFAVQTSFYQDIRNKRLAYVSTANGLKPGQMPTARQKETIAAWREIEISFLPNDKDVAEKTAIMQSDYARIAKMIRKESWAYQTTYLLYGIWDPLALMLMGMALMKWGFITGRCSRKKYLVIAIIGYAVGLPLVIYELFFTYKYIPDLAASFRLMEQTPVPWRNFIYPVQRMALVLAHVSVIMLMIRAGWFGRAFRNLAAVGQMAFTNYVMQTVFCSLFFFGYGLNYYNRLSYYEVFYIVFAIWLLQLVYSPLWLRCFYFGPLEWLWRLLTYWKWPPFKRK